ncbi:hypothetical protein [Kitasatospora sp. LaBMicrA B282]|uniref:hypothetical protein n=1 Tax=Kitasatospora sp. LaBMicrA B282 TaxID=3420949 RepID=UPI003D0DCC15
MRQVCRSPGRRVNRIERSRTVAATTASARAASSAATTNTPRGLSACSSRAATAYPTIAVPPVVMFNRERAGAYASVGSTSASRPIRVPVPSDWKNPSSRSSPNRAASGSPGTAWAATPARDRPCSATRVRRGRRPSATDISVSAPNTVAKVAPYMLTAVRKAECVCRSTRVPRAKPDSVLAASTSVKPA